MGIVDIILGLWLISFGQVFSVALIIAGSIVFIAGVLVLVIYFVKPDYFRKKAMKQWEKKHPKKD
jgi:hypothetical protein